MQYKTDEIIIMLHQKFLLNYDLLINDPIIK